MKKFTVNLYYHGCVSVEVSAKDEESAIEQAENIVDAMDDSEFMREAELLGDGADVYEVKI